ncbi:MAG: hypothetical protein ACKN9V_07450, partial [Pseudomonadota bacterium]
FSIFAPLNWELLRARTWFLTCFSGVLFFIGLNAIRIVSLFSLGVVVGSWWGREAALKMIMGVFHTHMGYLLYALGLGLFFRTIVMIAEKKKAPAAAQPIYQN